MYLILVALLFYKGVYPNDRDLGTALTILANRFWNVSKSKCVADGCNLQPSKICSGCKQVRYCSAECQKKAWAEHKIICKRFPTLEASQTFLDSYKFPDVTAEMKQWLDTMCKAAGI